MIGNIIVFISLCVGFKMKNFLSLNTTVKTKLNNKVQSYKMNNNTSYIILSGLFEFDYKLQNQAGILKDYTGWHKRINGGDYESTLNHLSTGYYDSYGNLMFPEAGNIDALEDLSNNYLNHLTHKKTLSGDLKECFVQLRDRKLAFTIDFIDLYLFPHSRGIFSFKIDLGSDASLEDASDVLNALRQLYTTIECNGKSLSVGEFVDSQILSSFNNVKWKEFTPQLKSYTILDLDQLDSDKQMDELLYDFGNVSPLGSAAGNGGLAPATSYLENQLSEHKISVFKNWSALCLFDTFTRVSVDFPDRFKSWEYDYFNIYVLSLYVKFFMYSTNTALSDVTDTTADTSKVRDEFIEFINDYHIGHISYKFLPNLLLQKLQSSLDIQNEIDKMELKVNRINEHLQEKREKNFNKLLSLLTFLGVIPLIGDISDWAVKMGASENVMFPWGSLITGFCLVTLILWIIKRK
ncbi:MAG: hypothetical protein ACI9N1_001323 [Flavobacteriales bacterium]|jgi:hypothetical protein